MLEFSGHVSLFPELYKHIEAFSKDLLEPVVLILKSEQLDNGGHVSPKLYCRVFLML